MLKKLKSILFGALLGTLIPTLALGQASLLPNAKQQYLDDSGTPIDSGTVGYYTPGSTVNKKTVWQDAAETTPQTNPVPLDNAGRPQPAGQTYGSGCYQQVVKDQNNIQIWSAVTCSASGGGGTSPAFSEGVMVGTILPWANMTLPSKYLYAAGQAVSRASFPDLLTALTFQPVVLCQTGIATVTVSTDISDKTPIGAPVEFSCFTPGTTVASKSSGQLTMSTNATATVSVAGQIFPWGNGDGATTFNVPETRGRIPVGRNNMNGSTSSTLTSTFYINGLTPVNPNAINSVAGNQSHTQTLAETPTGLQVSGVVHTFAGGASGNSLGMVTTSTTISSANVNTTGGTVTVPITSAGVWTGVNDFSGNNTLSSSNTSGAAHSIIQPSVTADYIVKALPDDTPGGPGVSSIQGMTGAIACGSGLICTANTITVSIGAVTLTVGLTPIVSGTSGRVLFDNAGLLGEYATVPVANGGTNLASGTSGGVLCFTAGTTLASSVAMTANAIMLGGGAGACPTPLGSLGTTTTVLHGNAAGAPSFAAVNMATDVTGILAIANGGSSQSTALAARSSSGFNIDEATSTGDANYTILSTDRMVYHTALSAARTDTLPAANSVNAGQQFVINDFRGVASASNTVTLQRAGGDTINGVTSVVAVNAQFGAGIFWSDGSSRWTFQPVSAGGGGGTVNSVAADGGLATGTGTAITNTGTVYAQNIPPGGRLTLTSGTPITTTDVAAATTLYYAPLNSVWVPIYNGTIQRLYQFTSSDTDAVGLSIALGSNWTTNTNYDAFIGLNTGTVTLCTGPAWSSDTSRGTGAGTTELQLFKGLFTNKNSMTCRFNNTTTFTCAVNQCTYVGTARTVAAGQMEDSKAKRFVYNAYNQVDRVLQNANETTDSWNYTTATLRQANANTANQLDVVVGLPGNLLDSTVYAKVQNTGTTALITIAGIGVDSTTVNSATQMTPGSQTIVANARTALLAKYQDYVPIGRHFFAWLESSTASGTTSWFGDDGNPTATQCGISGKLSM